jgi:hypothetical protein
MKATVRSAAVLLAICSWFAISNHCAFAALATKTESAQTGCPFHSKPAKQTQQNAQVQCCKILRAVLFAKTKGWARDDTNFSDLDPLADQCPLMAPSLRPWAPLSLDTGPPGADSFAELVLQRSLFANAPPSLA